MMSYVESLTQFGLHAAVVGGASGREISTLDSHAQFSERGKKSLHITL